MNNKIIQISKENKVTYLSIIEYNEVFSQN